MGNAIRFMVYDAETNRNWFIAVSILEALVCMLSFVAMVHHIRASGLGFTKKKGRCCGGRSISGVATFHLIHFTYCFLYVVYHIFEYFYNTQASCGEDNPFSLSVNDFDMWVFAVIFAAWMLTLYCFFAHFEKLFTTDKLQRSVREKIRTAIYSAWMVALFVSRR